MIAYICCMRQVYASIKLLQEVWIALLRSRKPIEGEPQVSCSVGQLPHITPYTSLRCVSPAPPCTARVPQVLSVEPAGTVRTALSRGSIRHVASRWAAEAPVRFRTPCAALEGPGRSVQMRTAVAAPPRLSEG